MPLRNQRPLVWPPSGLIDAVDGTLAPKGALWMVGNLIPALSNPAMWQSRPAAVPITGIGGFFDYAGGPVTVLYTTGDIAYGMYPSSFFPGFDRPFAYDMARATFMPIDGVTANNLPASQPTTGPWVPPTARKIASRIIFTHAGFPGGTIKFGWLDLSGFTSTSLTATTSLGSPALTAVNNVLGLQPGMTISGAGIPAGSTIIDFNNPIIVESGNGNNSGDTHIILNYGVLSTDVPPFQFPFSGQQVTGTGIAAATTVSGAPTIISQTATMATVSVPLSTPTIGSLNTNPVLYTFSGSYTITISQNATANASGVSLTIAGGTPTRPLWGAGDTAINHLVNVPVFVRQFFNRAYFGVNTTMPPTAGVTASDSGFPCVVTGANQVQLFEDAIPVNGGAELPLTTLVGGIVQSLIVFQGDANFRQITGDFALGTWEQNASQVATGTLAPNSVASTPKGTMFMAPDGLRLINFDGTVTDPIGTRGKGIGLPFIHCLEPTRVVATFNEDIYRITVPWSPPPEVANVWGTVSRLDEFWFHLDTQTFSGPHTSTMDVIAPWSSQSSFICVPTWGEGRLYKSDPWGRLGTSFVENAGNMAFTFRTILLPDNPEGMANTLNEAAIFCSLPNDEQWIAAAIDDQDQTLDQTYIWLGPNEPRAMQPIWWRGDITFRQLSIQITGSSAQEVIIGNLVLRYQRLGYQVTRPVPIEAIYNWSLLGDPNASPGP